MSSGILRCSFLAGVSFASVEAATPDCGDRLGRVARFGIRYGQSCSFLSKPELQLCQEYSSSRWREAICAAASPHRIYLKYKYTQCLMFNLAALDGVLLRTKSAST